MFINHRLGEINFNIAYWGSAKSGKTANLQYIHSRTNLERRGELVSIQTSRERTLFFDFIYMELSRVNGLKTNFNFCTVPT